MADQSRNPRNNVSPLFKALTRIFSGPIINYNQRQVALDRRKNLNKYSNKFKSLAGLDFKKSRYNPYDYMQTAIMVNHNRAERYLDFDQMEYMPELASALDIYADEMTTHSILTPLLKIDCHNEELKSILEELYYNVLNIDSNLFSWCRNMCKYGDYFLYLDVDEKMGVTSAIGLPLREIERLEGEDKSNPNYIQYQWNNGGLTFENWQMAHFRVLGNDKYAPYGTSVLESARRIWRQLTLMEDAMMAYRIVRAPERRVFKIDVGGIPPEDVEQYMQKVITNMKRHQLVDPDNGQIDLRYNPMSVEEDYYLPVRQGSATEIVSLPGGQNAAAIDDVNYLRDKMFSAIKIPKSYLSQLDQMPEEKTTLAQKDIRFARTIQRLQRSVVAELEKIGIIHLYTLGYRGEDIISFDLSLNNPSKLAQIQELEFIKQKFEVAGAAQDTMFSRRWIAEHIFGMDNEEFLRNQRERYFDKRIDKSLEASAEEPAFDTPTVAPAAEIEAEAEPVPELGAEEEAPEATPEATPEPAAEPAAPAAEEETTPLLVEPGAAKRDDSVNPVKMTFKDGSEMYVGKGKGKRYKPVSPFEDGRKSAGRKKNFLSTAGKSKDIGQLGRGMVENKETIYNSLAAQLESLTERANKIVNELETEDEV
tara:strand:+ start:2785 stop:4728 length:1944 start_codon:yes stop_codon:yes gene_type:complete